MTYYPHSESEITEMLEKINMKNLDDLIKPIPDKFKIKQLNLDDGKTELEASLYFEKLANNNKEYSSIFMGAGAYNHYIPAIIDEITGRQEFYTAYTPYQAEISQGTLRSIFEYQTFITRLTGMDVTNASMYDGATAVVESIIMAVKINKKNKILVDKFIHPEYMKVIKTYLKPLKIEIDILQSNPYIFDYQIFKKTWNNTYSCFVISSPNYCGTILDLSEISSTIHNDKGIFIQCIHEAMSLSLLKSPGEYNVDIVCGEAQSFGIPLSFGGPYLGFLACKKDFMRKIPGRIVGQSVDKNGDIAYILTLSTREQHIRRDSATSNICSNHGLCAIRASIYLSILGEKGIKSCGLKNIENSHYLYEQISKIKNFRVINKQFFFNEFVVETEIKYSKIKNLLEKNDILSFLPLKNIDKSLNNSYLVCSTEINTKEQIDNFIKLLRSL